MGGPNKLFISHFQLHLFTCYKASKERGNLILVLSRIVHQSRRQHEWIIEERKQLFSSNGSWYCADHYQRYRLRFWITWKPPCLFSYCYKFSPTSSLQLPSIQLSDRWSNRHFGMWATLYWSHHPENILVRLQSGPAYCVYHFKLSFMYPPQSYIWWLSVLIDLLPLRFHWDTKTLWRSGDLRLCL